MGALDLVVGADGSGVVDAAQLTRFGVKPGTHLSVVPVGPAGGRGVAALCVEA